MNIQETEKLV